MRLMASLTKAEFATLCEQTRTKEIDAIRKVVEHRPIESYGPGHRAWAAETFFNCGQEGSGRADSGLCAAR